MDAKHINNVLKALNEDEPYLDLGTISAVAQALGVKPTVAVTAGIDLHVDVDVDLVMPLADYVTDEDTVAALIEEVVRKRLMSHTFPGGEINLGRIAYTDVRIAYTDVVDCRMESM